MERINVVVTASLNGQVIPVDGATIKNISPLITVTDASALLSQEQKGDLSSRAEFDAALKGADVLYAMRPPRDFLKRAPNVKWVQSMAAGADTFLDKDWVNSPVILTNVSGIHAVPISEYVIGVMIMFAKQIPHCYQLRQEKKWSRFKPMVLRGKIVGIVGLGHIGREVARLAKCFGMKVMATRRSATEDSRARYVDNLVPPQRLPELLSKSDFIALTLPSTRETTHIIGEKELRLMKPTSYLINIGRGNAIDEPALVRALEEHWIAGAGLDVFAQEPLPPDSKLWNLPNVIFSPHISGNMEDYSKRATDVFLGNLVRFMEGKRLLHVVDKKRGY